jgi:hypothetical protein
VATGVWTVQGDYRLAGWPKGLASVPTWEIFLRALISGFQMMLYQAYIVLLIIVVPVYGGGDFGPLFYVLHDVSRLGSLDPCFSVTSNDRHGGTPRHIVTG